MEDIQYDVFISYSRRDYKDETGHIIPDNVVSEIKELLKDNNISYWFDEDGITIGEDFAKKIVANMKKSLIVLFLASHNSNKSKDISWTSKEISTALNLKKHILPVRLDDSAYNESVMFYISELDFVEYYNDKEKAKKSILDSILHAKAEYEATLRKQEQERQEAAQKKQEREQRESKQKAQKELYDKLEKDIDMLCAEEHALDGRHASIHNRIISIEDTTLKERLLSQLEQSNPSYYKELLQTRALSNLLEKQEQQIAQLEQTQRALEQENGTYKQMLDAAKTQLSKANKELSETKQQLTICAKELTEVQKRLNTVIKEYENTVKDYKAVKNKLIEQEESIRHLKKIKNICLILALCLGVLFVGSVSFHIIWYTTDFYW